MQEQDSKRESMRAGEEGIGLVADDTLTLNDSLNNVLSPKNNKNNAHILVKGGD